MWHGRYPTLYTELRSDWDEQLEQDKKPGLKAPRSIGIPKQHQFIQWTHREGHASS